MCTCVFLFRQESFDVILATNSLLLDGGVTVGIRANPCYRGL
jgi:hypothetical protein